MCTSYIDGWSVIKYTWYFVLLARALHMMVTLSRKTSFSGWAVLFLTQGQCGRGFKILPCELIKNILRRLPPSATCPRLRPFIPLYRLPLNTYKLQHSSSFVFLSDMEEVPALFNRFNIYPDFTTHTHDTYRNVRDSLRRADACEPSDPANTVTDRLNNLLKTSGTGYVLQLCPKETYLIKAPITFASANQEISTAGYPTDDTRATLLVSGPVFANGTGHTTAVEGTCSTCSNLVLRNIQVCRNMWMHTFHSNQLN